MSLRSRVDAETGIIFHEAEGLLTAEELLDALDRAASDASFRPGMNVLWDLTRSTIEGGTSDEVQALAAAVGRRQRQGDHHKVAIVAPHDLAYGLARMYEAYTGELPIELNVFRSSKEALKWLQDESTGL